MAQTRFKIQGHYSKVKSRSLFVVAQLHCLTNVPTMHQLLSLMRYSPEKIFKLKVTTRSNQGDMTLHTYIPYIHAQYQPSTPHRYSPDNIIMIYLFGVLRRFQHCTGHITTGSWKGRGNQYIEFARVVYCKLPTNGKQLPAL